MAHSRTLRLVLPPADIEIDIFTHGSLKPSFEGCTYVLSDIPSTLRHASYLLAILAEVSSTTAASYNTSPSIQGYIGWILDSICDLLNLEKTLRQYMFTQGSGFELCILYLHTVHSLTSSLRNLLPDFMIRKGYYVLTLVCVEILEFPEALSQTPVQSSFCGSLLDLAAISADHEPIAQIVSLRLLPALLSPEYPEANPIVKDPDFRVRLFKT